MLIVVVMLDRGRERQGSQSLTSKRGHSRQGKKGVQCFTRAGTRRAHFRINSSSEYNDYYTQLRIRIG